MEYIPISESPLIEVKDIFSFYHFQFATGYVFKGERHPFWEMVYVISGQVDIGADEKTYMLTEGDIIFHRPDEFHSIWANYAHSPDLIVMTFSTQSEAMKSLEKSCFRATSKQRHLLRQLLTEAEHVFVSPLDEGDKIISPEYPGGVYTLRLILTLLLVDVSVHIQYTKLNVRTAKVQRNAEAAESIDRILEIMRQHPRGELQFEEICRQVGMSGTVIKQLFKKYLNISPMAYYEQIRMSDARRLLKEKGGNIAAVADELGFSGAGYFSTRFKAVNGMTPREYIKENLD